MKVYIKKHESHAGKWIYEGYYSAWKRLGYDVEYYSNLQNISDNDYYLMALDGDVNKDNLKVISRSNKTFLFAQPNVFPMPWGAHPNFVSSISQQDILEINDMDNVHLWTFADVSEEYFPAWKPVNTIPLAFDSINYENSVNKDFAYDVCFVGGWANNGFNEKKKIMIDVFSKFKQSGLRCGFFINKNVSHKAETEILSSSRVCLNIHDAYQRLLGLDTNERTFKSLGLNGLLVSDKIKQLDDMFPEVYTSLNTTEIVNKVKEYVDMPDGSILEEKEKNRIKTITKHCYTNRVEAMIGL